jgi:hypothetical protein
VEQATVGTGADFIDNVGLEVAVDGSGNIFALACIMVLRKLRARGYVYVYLFVLTGLGKKGAEALIWFGGFPLLGQVSIRL